MTKNNTHFVFVYGTLKQKNSTNDIKLLGNAVTNKHYLLFNGGYPLAIEDDANTNKQGKIRGQLLEVSDAELRRMDSYEGHPEFYKRTPTSVHCNGLDHDAFIYLGEGARNSIPHREIITPDDKGELFWEFR